MKISELRAGQGKVDVEAEVKSKAETRTFNKYGRELKVCNAVVSDDSGQIKLSLWNSDIDKVNVGDKVKITNGYVSEFNGEKQLTSGKFGKLEVIENADKEESGEKSEKHSKKAEKSDEEKMEDSEMDDVAF